MEFVFPYLFICIVFFLLFLVTMVHIAVVTSIAVVSSVATASIVCFKMFCRCKMALLGRCRAEVDSELGPAQACIGGDPEKGAAALRRFRWPEVESLTARFAPSAVIGEGGSSIVYLGRLPDSSFAAVKLNRPSERLRRAFRRELDVLRPLRHANVVRLLGYCDDREEQGVLVFEYVPEGSLHEQLHERGAALPWERRMEAALQVARALEYLHEGCDPPVVHGDVKAANVLLGGSTGAKLCDFGSASAGFSAAVAEPRRAMAVGSPGYVDPHYLRTGMVSKKSDVYSFGVLLLELVTGAEAFDAEREVRLTAAMGTLLREPGRKAAEEVDARLGGEYDAGEAAAAVAVAAMCLAENPALRPSMTEVVAFLRQKKAVRFSSKPST
ncbi:salt tolerance receptor-like cytoplasmic kinase 1 [Zingiber officinale]|uniref:Protein kinase domain-containing protein n=1 Tax=Zingiber officinale TaxID=94328 RepID=A0A8J5H488_ZINOF|nr:salt tolerance receptor-like cytoplasmic kinase 1 [Zingiber officinale]KAG6515474.1 hypothetical protein ZIOFF_025888 [Zingiber officinale]